ncbi:peptidylprolyl isomerase [bacterium]|nr:peptidylprolyl isomerase [bacterium]
MRRGFIIGVLAAVLGILGCTCEKQKPGADSTGKAEGMVIETQNGKIEIEFFPNDAPKTVARIKELVASGFYNGLTFHRVVEGFVVQGGDPKGTGTGGSGVNLKAEFNGQKHVEGTVAMARAQDPDSADSQFYISLGTHPHLDGNYTVFGKVTSGMDAVKKIKVGDKMTKVSLK